MGTHNRTNGGRNIMGRSRLAGIGIGIVCALALAATAPAAAPAPARERSAAATRGSAPFTSADLWPGAPLALERLTLTQPQDQVVALTIDDGPEPRDRTLRAVLSAAGARATFFYIGTKVARTPELARETGAAGFEVGSHSWSHPMMSDQPPAGQQQELTAANQALGRAGLHPAWFRPPFGDFDQETVRLARTQGLETILWTIDTQDWKGRTAAEIRQRVAERLRPGAVILMHSTKPASLEALPGILADAAARGLRVVDLTQWRQTMLAAARRAQAPGRTGTGE